MTIQVLGSGCPACHKLFETTQKAAEELGMEANVEYITGDKATQKIIELGLMSSPVLLIDGVVAMTGATTKVEKVKQVLSKQCDCDCCCQNGCVCEGTC